MKMTNFFEWTYRVLGVPFGWVLTELYNILPNYVLVIVVFTIASRFLMLPTNLSQRKSAAIGQRLNPKMRRIEQKYAGNQQKIAQEKQALTAREGAAGMNLGCMGMLITMPIMYGLNGAIYYPLKYPLFLHKLFGDVNVPELLEKAIVKLAEVSPDLGIKPSSLVGKESFVLEHIDKLVNSSNAEVMEIMSGVPAEAIARIRDFIPQFQLFGYSLGITPDWGNLTILVPIATALFSVATSIFSMLQQRKQNPGQQQNLAMLGCTGLLMPAMMFFFAISMPVAVGIYWAIGSAFALVQSILLSRLYQPKKVLAELMVNETINRCAREKEQRPKPRVLPGDLSA
jgi:YidC/Oxa1 family membrane protein insertase